MGRGSGCERCRWQSRGLGSEGADVSVEPTVPRRHVDLDADLDPPPSNRPDPVPPAWSGGPQEGAPGGRPEVQGVLSERHGQERVQTENHELQCHSLSASPRGRHLGPWHCPTVGVGANRGSQRAGPPPNPARGEGQMRGEGFHPGSRTVSSHCLVSPLLSLAPLSAFFIGQLERKTKPTQKGGQNHSDGEPLQETPRSPCHLSMGLAGGGPAFLSWAEGSGRHEGERPRKEPSPHPPAASSPPPRERREAETPTCIRVPRGTTQAPWLPSCCRPSPG